MEENNEANRLELIASQFKELVEQRDYHTARELYNGLNEDDKGFISGHPEYRWYVKKLRFSCI